jgi:hypothetical protein
MSSKRASAEAPVESLTPRAPSVGVDRMLRIQGYTDPRGVRRTVRAAAERNARRAAALFEPAVCYRRVAVRTCSEGVLSLPGDIQLHCAAFSRFLSAAGEIAVFVATAGSRIDDELTRLNDEQQLLDMLLLESAAWLGLEAITKSFVAQLRARAAREGLRLTRRMGPGYDYKIEDGTADWPLEEQEYLFALLGDTPLPVTLLESCAMLPKMSRSGLIGLVPSTGPQSD